MDARTLQRKNNNPFTPTREAGASEGIARFSARPFPRGSGPNQPEERSFFSARQVGGTKGYTPVFSPPGIPAKVFSLDQFNDLDGYEVEIAFEFPKLVYSKPTTITSLVCKMLSYRDLSKTMLDKFSRKP